MEHQQSSKGPGKKHQPGGMIILHEDKEIIVVVKPAGLLTIGTDRDKTRTAHYLLNDYVRKGDPKSRNRVYVVHRLDQDTSGILLFAKSEAAKIFLQENWEKTEKYYLAIVHGRLIPPEGTISSFLTENAAQRVYSTPDPAQGKLATTEYKVLQGSRKGFSLVEIHLLTGRKHQIRVHFAERGHPVVGDKKYNNNAPVANRLALHARSLAFTHPFNGRRMIFDTGMPEDFVRLLAKL
ncbi:MAG: RluA family pseudouridine synthase [Desulfuromonadales bacterium]|nr:RluA family pseudouridine synthase [Desulfuromonadales bacterium]